MTRRALAAAVFAPAAAGLAQTQAAPPDPLAAARQRLADNAAAVAKVELPMAVEPAFQFKA